MSSLHRLSRRLPPAVLFLLGLACAGPAAVPSQQAGQPVGQPASAAAPRKPADILTFHGADWLERPDRAAEEKPELVVAAMDLRPGQTVAEVGCGTGYMARRVAPSVGPTGKVLCEEIQPEMLVLAKKYAARDGLKNVVTVLGTETDPKLPKAGVDRVLMVDVYHEFQKPRPMLEKIRESLAPGGTVTLVEYRLEGDTAAQINLDHRMSVEQVTSEWTAAGFLLLRREETLPSQHLFTFSAKRGARPIG